MDQSVEASYCATASNKSKAISILTLAELAGMSTGIVTTTRVTHATPACTYAHSVSRRWESDKDKETKAKDDASGCNDIGNYRQ